MGFLPGQLSPPASSVKAPSHTAETALETSFFASAHSTATTDSSKPSEASFPSPPAKNPKPHTCSVCQRSFARSEHLNRHKLSHTKEKPFECTKCGRCFARRDLLLRHQRKLHPTSLSAKKDAHINKPNGPNSAHAPAILSQFSTFHDTSSISERDERKVLNANTLPPSELGDPAQNDVPASPALSASSYGSTDTGVSHPPNAKREGKKIVPMGYGDFSNQSRTEPAGRVTDDYFDSDGEFGVQSSTRRYYRGHEVECPRPDCNRSVKDLAAHLVTHENERPEKCFVPTCEYHIKGFGRKYDRDRHSLTHFNGTMICDFCPDSAMSDHNCFSRVDVFKRHLSTVHGVEQMPPNKRKRPVAALTINELTHPSSDTAGKCSVCCNVFPDVHLFYEHLDDCTAGAIRKSLQTTKIPLALPTKTTLVAPFTVVDKMSAFEDSSPSPLSRT